MMTELKPANVRGRDHFDASKDDLYNLTEDVSNIVGWKFIGTFLRFGIS